MFYDRANAIFKIELTNSRLLKIRKLLLELRDLINSDTHLISDLLGFMIAELQFIG